MNFRKTILFLKHSTIVKVLTNKFVIATIVFALWITVFSPNNIFVWIDELNTLSDQNKQIDAYKMEIEHTENELKLLRSNRDSIEKFARETYLFHAEDEEIFVVDPAKE